MSTALGIRDRPGHIGTLVCPALQSVEFRDYRTAPNSRDAKLTLWVNAPANGNLRVDRVDASSGASGTAGSLGTLFSGAVAGSTFETPVGIDSEVGGQSQLRVTWTDTSNTQTTVTIRVGERRFIT